MNHTMKALLLVVPMFAAASVSAGHCSKWKTWKFWEDATGEAVRGCLAQGADPNARDKHGTTPLHWAARCGRADAVSALLKGGADLSARDEAGWTPLHRAARNGHADAVSALLKGGADHNARKENGETPLHIADNYGHADVVSALLKGGADPALRLDPEEPRYYVWSHEPCDAEPNDASRRRPHHPQTTTPRYRSFSIEP